MCDGLFDAKPARLCHSGGREPTIGSSRSKPRFSDTQIWVFVKQPNLLVELNRRKLLLSVMRKVRELKTEGMRSAQRIFRVKSIEKYLLIQCFLEDHDFSSGFLESIKNKVLNLEY